MKKKIKKRKKKKEAKKNEANNWKLEIIGLDPVPKFTRKYSEKKLPEAIYGIQLPVNSIVNFGTGLTFSLFGCIIGE